MNFLQALVGLQRLLVNFRDEIVVGLHLGEIFELQQEVGEHHEGVGGDVHRAETLAEQNLLGQDGHVVEGEVEVGEAGETGAERC